MTFILGAIFGAAITFFMLNATSSVSSGYATVDKIIEGNQELEGGKDA